MRPSWKRAAFFLFVAMAWTVGSAAEAPAAVYNLHLATDNVPDYTDIDSFVESATGQCKTPAEKCIAVWRWGRRSRRQTSCAGEDGRLVWDPILHYNSYGAMNCGVISSLNIASFLKLGYRARYIQLGDHTVSEVSWDDGRTWHLLDSSMSFFCYNHDGQVASCEEIKQAAACDLSGGRSEPGHFYFYHGAPQCRTHLGPDGWRSAADQPVAYQRTLLNGASSYTDGFSVDRYTQYARYGRRYILNLRPCESYTRYWRPLDRDNPDVAEQDRPDYYRPLKGADPDQQHGLHNLRGNGVWVFRPDLAAGGCLDLLHDFERIEARGPGGQGPAIRPVAAGRPAAAVFKVSAANVITSMRIEATAVRRRDDDRLRVCVSRYGGLDWTPVWQSDELGPQDIRLRLRDEVAGVTECLVKFEMTAGQAAADVGLQSLVITTITQLNRRTLPALTLGANQVRLSADQQADSTVIWPPLHAGLFRRTACDVQDVYSDQQPDGMYKATLGAAVDGRECHATWRVETPTDITGVTYGVVVTNRSGRSYVALQQSLDGTHYTEFYRKTDGDAPFDKQVVHTVAGGDVPPGARQALLKAVFFCPSAAATYNMPGIQDLWIRVSHKPRSARFEPIEVTYNWTEHREGGDVTRSHTELVESLPHQYAVNVAGFRDPTLNWVRINLKGYGPDGAAARPGYSDGQDVGDRYEPRKLTYTWGTNLARDCSYTASRPSSKSSGNPDRGGELTNGAIIAPTDIATAEMVQRHTAFWEPGEPVTFVVDLGRTARLAGVRVSTHQPDARYCHPEQVEIAVSTDGTTWRHAGTIRQNDLWNPPGDYEPWEHDDSPEYDDLPAGGRLAYGFPAVFEQPESGRLVRFVFTPLPGKGMGISELEVFDRASAAPSAPVVAPFAR